MTPELKERWIEALGTYPKTKGRLKNEEGYCCLGVLADIEGDLEGILKWDSTRLVLPAQLIKKYDIPSAVENKLMAINDQTSTFDSVISEIKKEL